MEQKSEMEILYQEYLKRDDLIISIDGIKYYRIIKKEYLSLHQGMIIITVPWELFKNSKCDSKVVNENGNSFILGGSIHYRFRGHIPEWYLNTVSTSVCNIKNPDLIGDYLTIDYK